MSDGKITWVYEIADELNAIDTPSFRPALLSKLLEKFSRKSTREQEAAFIAWKKKHAAYVEYYKQKNHIDWLRREIKGAEGKV